MSQHSHDTDQWLLEQIADGKESAFRELFDRYREWLYDAIFRMIRSDAVTHDIIQELFIRIWNKREKLRDIQDADGYLFTMAYRAMYTELRKIAQQNRLKTQIKKDTVEDVQIDEQDSLMAQRKEQVEAVLTRLPKQQEKIYRLAKQEGMTREEIAKRLQLSPNTVRNHLSEAVKTLTRLLRQTGIWLLWEIFFKH